MLEANPLTAELSEKTFSLLEQPPGDVTGWKESVLQLVDGYGPDVYTNLLHLLTNLDFSPQLAKAHWENALTTWEELNCVLSGSVDLRVAVLHYFLEVQKTLENPTIVEIKLYQKVRDSVVLDELTQLYNYRYFRDRIEQEVKRGQRFNLGLSLLMLDADDFKLFNDRNGHLSGNLALREMAQLFKDCVREVDVVTRYGGEEFAIILPATFRTGALIVSEKIRSRIEKAAIQGQESQPQKTLTVSIGVATMPTDAADTEELIHKADMALYKAKKLGKNKVQAFSDERRSFARYHASLAGHLQILDHGASPVTTYNISQGGFLIATNQRLPIGGIVQLELEYEGEKRMECTARVARVFGHAKECRAGLEVIHVEPAQLYQFREYLSQFSEHDRIS